MQLCPDNGSQGPAPKNNNSLTKEKAAKNKNGEL
jgi:hypothetical protein